MKHLPQSEAMRRTMVDSQLRPSGVNVAWVLAAMLETPREIFLPGQESIAYVDRALPVADGRWLNPPVAHAQMLMLADLADGDRVLLVGAGSGYLAALLGHRGIMPVAVEESALLGQAFAANLPNVKLVHGPLAAGAADHAPFDCIIIDGAISALPDSLVAQLVDGGRVVAGLSEGPVTRLANGIKRGSAVALRPAVDMEIDPLPGFAQRKEFVF